MGDSDFIKIFTTTDQIENGIVVSMLHENGIESVVMNKQDTAYVSIGEIELYVAKQDHMRAQQLIEEFRRPDSR